MERNLQGEIYREIVYVRASSEITQMYTLWLVVAVAFSITALLLIWLRKNDPEGVKRISGTRNYKRAMILALIVLLLSSALLIYLIYFLWPILRE